MTTNQLYALAATMGVETHSVKCPTSQAISLELNGSKFIGIDPSVLKSDYRERLVLAHELGHAATNAYYSAIDNPVNVKRMEHRATKWMIEKLIPKSTLAALLHPDVTVFELAEELQVPEELIKKALFIYFRTEI